MIDRLARNPGSVYALLAVYFAVNFMLRIAAPASLELDEGQQLFLTQWLALGYDTQPPLYNWLQHGVVQLFGSTVLALTLLKNTLLFACYLFFGLASHIVVRDRTLAVIATLGIITIPQIGYEAQRDLTHTVALLMSACMFLYFFFLALERPTALNYALTGLAIGLGILSKYNFVLLPAVAVLAALSTPSFRSRVFDPRVLLTIAAAVIIVTPHALWFVDHIGEATQRTLSKLGRSSSDGFLHDTLTGIKSLAGAIAAVMLPTLGAFAVAFGRDLKQAWEAESRWTKLLGNMMVAATLMLILVVASGEVTYIGDRWIAPLFLVIPLYLCAKIEAAGLYAASARRRFGAIILAVMVLVPLVLFARPFLGLAGIYGKQNVPYGPAVAAILSSNEDRPAIILAGDQQLAGNLRLHASDIPVSVPGYERFQAPFAFDEKHPVLVVWRKRNGASAAKMTSGLKRLLGAATGTTGGKAQGRDLALPYIYGREGDLYHFSYAWIYPDR